EATVSAFVDQILQEALRLRATDIHLEPYTNSIRLRYRVDGILETVPVPADMRQLYAAIVSRLKIMAALNIAEKRLPHDGRIAMGLRSVLRHDPDVVLVGEIRDFETAEIAVRAAQTGHLVFSTLHTNDSISAVTRLLEMKIEPYLISSSLVCSVSQRLLRRIC